MKRTIVFILFLLSACTPKQNSSKDIVFVSILPQKYIVERIAGDDIAVEVMVRPGHSPATYEVLPKQMEMIGSALLYFRIGVSFEKSWIDKIQNANPGMKIIDVRENITLREFDTFEEHTHSHDEEHEHDGEHEHDEDHDEEHTEDHQHTGKDPHIWLSPSNMKVMADTVYSELAVLYPDKKEEYKKNLVSLHTDLDDAALEVRKSLSTLKNRKIMVFHPAFGYFADEFNLKQIPIEVEGKEPGPQTLKNMIDHANEENINIIFVQKQFSTSAAEAVAEGINGSVVQIDPLDEDYIRNLKLIGKTIAEKM